MRKIKDFENYLIDENGNVYSLITHKAITTYCFCKGALGRRHLNAQQST